jgi:hypothetical protein
VADHELKEHAEAEAVTKELENTDEGDPQFDTLVRWRKISATTSTMRKVTYCPTAGGV